MSSFGQWFTEVSNELKKSGKLRELEAEFNKQPDDLGRVTVLRAQTFAGKKIKECYKTKCNKKSEEFRNAGNKEYGNKHFDNAISMYTNSIAYAEEKSREISLAYANRSVVLFATKDYQLCEMDIHLAFANGYPMNLQYKLYERLGKCYIEMGSIASALRSFRTGLASLNDSGLEVTKKNDIARLLFKLCSRCENRCEKDSDKYVPIKNYVYKVDPPVIPEGEVNKVYPCATKSFRIAHEEDGGRYAVAARDIAVGEIIIVEKAFSSLCLPECLSTHCYSCLSRFKVSYPCRNCASVRFCCIECEEITWRTFHCYECSYFDLLVRDDIGLGHLALKMIIEVGKAGLSQFSTQHKQSLADDKFGRNKQGVFEPTDYHCVYSLVGNSNKREPSDLFRRTLIAIWLSNILHQAGLRDVDFNVLATHLLKQLQMLPCNAHEVSELRLEGDEVSNSELKEIGSAVYTTLSLLNHSCDPSVVRHCYGDTCVLRSVKFIKEGEAIVDNYGHLYPVEEKANRQKYLLEQYYFTCKCIACEQNWPLYNEIDGSEPQFHCSKCNGIIDNGKCDQCGIIDSQLVNFHELQVEYESCVQKVLDSGKFVDTLPTLLNYLSVISAKAQLPIIHLNNCQEIVKLCFGLQGNYFKS